MPPYVWMPPACLDAPHMPPCMSGHPHMFGYPCVLGCPLCLDAPHMPPCMLGYSICLDAPICLDDVWMLPVHTQHK